jgi:methionyl aminopeptidase
VRRRREDIQLKTPDQIRRMRAAGLVVAAGLAAMAEAAKPGVSTHELDQIARKVLADANAVSSFLGYAGPPA